MSEKEEQIQEQNVEVCESITEDRYFWNELHIIVEDGAKASNEDE